MTGILDSKPNPLDTALRARQHSDSDDEEKKLKRRQRFGITTKGDEQAAIQAKKAELMDPARLKARAERFGAIKPTAGLSDADKKKVRRELG